MRSRLSSALVSQLAEEPDSKSGGCEFESHRGHQYLSQSKKIGPPTFLYCEMLVQCPDMRVLGRVRLSRLTDESTSTERQREVIETWAKQNDHTLIGFAEDLDVSGSVDPFDTPALGPWLTDRHHEWDIICAWKLDRLGRDAIRLNKLFGWAMDNGKTVVSATEGIDLNTAVGRLIANVIAFLAEGELEAIRERTKASQQKLRTLGRWGGGITYYGYQAQEVGAGAGWSLVPDEHSTAVLFEIIADVLAGKSTESITRKLNDRGELSPSDYLRYRAGKPIRGSKWSSTSIRQQLRSKTLLGHTMHRGVTVRDSEGVFIPKGPPLVDQETFDRIQAALDVRSFKLTNRSAGASPMLGVAFCAVCDRLMHLRRHHLGGKTYRYYQCVGDPGSKHSANTIRADDLEELVEDAFLFELGVEKVRERVFIPAENHQTDLDEAVRAVDELSTLMGTITSDTMRSRLTEQMRALDKRIAALELLPAREAQWDYRETEQTYSDAWNQADQEGRRQLLLRSGITAVVRSRKKDEPASSEAPDFELRIPDDLKERLSC